MKARSLNLSPVTMQAVRDVLGFYGYAGGQPPSGFTTALLIAWEKADMRNRAILADGFPHLAHAILLLQNLGGEELSRVAAAQQERRP